MEIKSVLLGLVIGAFLVLGGLYFYPTVADDIIPDVDPEYSFVTNTCNDYGRWYESHGGAYVWVKFREDGTGIWGSDWNRPDFTYTVNPDSIYFEYVDGTTETIPYTVVSEVEFIFEGLGTFYHESYNPQ